MIVFPSSTYLRPARLVAKDKVYLNCPKNVAKLKRIFTDEVEKMVFANKLSAKSLNLPEGSGVKEIDVIETTLTTPGVNAEIYKAIDTAVKPHNVLHLITTTDHFEVVFGYWPTGENTARYHVKSWPSRDVPELTIAGMTLDAVYVGIMEQLRGGGGHAGRVTLPSQSSNGRARAPREPLNDAVAWRERDARRAQLARQIAKLKAQRRNEKQMNRQFELAQEIRRLEKALELEQETVDARRDASCLTSRVS